MAMRTAMLKSAGESVRFTQGFRRWAHAAALPPPLDGSMSIQQPTASPTFVLPEFDRSSETNHNDFGFGFPSFPSDGAMDLMAVPKRKTSRHKRGIRNGPKALKPIPVIVRCKGCGRVKLPHFFCCSGDRGNTDSTS